MFVDFILNGEAHGAVGQRMQGCRFDPGMLRPFLDNRGQVCFTINTGKVRWDEATKKHVPIYEKVRASDLPAGVVDQRMTNNATTLLKESWIQLDDAVVRATRKRLRAWTDLMASARRPIGDAMGTMTLEYQAMTDPGEAVVDMDALADARTDRPLFNLKSVPLPITHSDFYFSQREIAVSRNRSMPLDTTMAEAAGRRVAEMIEKTLIGVETGLTFGTRSGDAATAHTGTSTVYGYTNFPYRVTKTNLTAPTGSNPEAVLTDLLNMVETMQTNGFYGPYMVYCSTGYSRYLSDDYFRTGSTSAVRSLRQRLLEIEDIQDIRRLDYLTTGFRLIMIQMDSEVAQAIDGLGVTTVQWESQGGMRQNFKVMAIQVPLLKSPYNGVAAIIDATTS